MPFHPPVRSSLRPPASASELDWMRAALRNDFSALETIYLVTNGFESVIRGGELHLDLWPIRDFEFADDDLSDPEGARVIEVVPERTQQAAAELLRSLPPEQREQIEAVAMDMWPAYISAVEEVLPSADIVFDRFHVKKHLGEAVDKVRRQEHRELSAARNLILKGSKYLWLKTHEDMRLKASRQFRALLVQDLQTGTAWALKENFDHFWNYRQWGRACRFLHHWMETVFAAGLGPLEKAAAMIGHHAEGILNYILLESSPPELDTQQAEQLRIKKAAEA